MRQKTYCAIIGDINRSRSLPGRAKVQWNFAAAVKKINEEFKDAVASKFLVTLGDEFQGLLHTAEKSYDLVRRFEDLMEPTPFAFGVGIGTLSTPLRKDKALGMDGEAFHRARQALSDAKRLKRTLCYSFDSDKERVVNALVALMDRKWLRLTARQRQITQLLKDESAKEVARHLRISHQAISKAKQSGAMVELDEASAVLRQLLATVNQPQKVAL
jgi:hypothetical protein